MALPSFDELKDYLKVETDEEDALIQGILDGANGWVTRYFGVPLDSDSRTFYNRWPRKGYRREPLEQITVPITPCDGSAVLTNPRTLEVVPDDTYTVDQRAGIINTVYGESFEDIAYTVEVSVGWDHDPDFFSVSEPVLRQAILWAGTDYYRRRNSGAEYEQSGGQVSITYTKDDVPPVLRGLLESLRPRGRAW